MRMLLVSFLNAGMERGWPGVHLPPSLSLFLSGLLSDLVLVIERLLFGNLLLRILPFSILSFFLVYCGYQPENIQP